MPTLAAFLNLLLGITLLILAAYGLRALWVRAVPPRFLAYLIAPGVAVHELSHAAACVLMGAKVHSMVLFRSDGSGEVKHGPPRIKHVGDVVIGLAPLVGCTLCLWLLGLLLQSPVNMYAVRAEGVHTDQLAFLWHLAGLVLSDLRLALETASLASWRTWVFLYFALCFTMGMAPSRQDLKNCAVGILVLCGLALVAHIIVDRLINASGDGLVFRWVANATIKLHYPFAVCAISAILAGFILLVTSPFRAGRRRRK